MTPKNTSEATTADDAVCDDADKLGDKLPGTGLGAEDAHSQGAPDAADEMDGYGAYRIVHPNPVKEDNREIDDHASNHADEECRVQAHLVGAGCNADQAGKNTVEAHRQSGFLEKIQEVYMAPRPPAAAAMHVVIRVREVAPGSALRTSRH